MTPIKILEVVNEYDQMIEKMGIGPKPHDHQALCTNMKDALEHIRSMIPKIRIFIAEGRIEKSF